MNPFAHILTWYDLQTLDPWEWMQQIHEDIGGAIEAGVMYPASPAMNVGLIE